MLNFNAFNVNINTLGTAATLLFGRQQLNHSRLRGRKAYWLWGLVKLGDSMIFIKVVSRTEQPPNCYLEFCLTKAPNTHVYFWSFSPVFEAIQSLGRVVRTYMSILVCFTQVFTFAPICRCDLMGAPLYNLYHV